MKSNVFIGRHITFEFENVVAVTKIHLDMEIWLFGGFKCLLTDAIEISNFEIWYKIYLENKFGVDEEDKQDEEVLGL